MKNNGQKYCSVGRFHPDNSKGFTLVELMVALAMSGIVVAAVYAAYVVPGSGC